MQKCFNLKKWDILGFFICMPFMFLLHFLYDLSGQKYIAALFGAANESVWEHTKIIFLPFLVFSIVEFFIVKPEFKRFLVSKTIALLFIDIGLITFFYTYSGVLGYNLLVVDIFSAFLILGLAFFISYKLYCSHRCLEKYFTVSVILLLALITAFFTFTLYPPHIALFKDSETGLYGIQ